MVCCTEFLYGTLLAMTDTPIVDTPMIDTPMIDTRLIEALNSRVSDSRSEHGTCVAHYCVYRTCTTGRRSRPRTKPRNHRPRMDAACQDRSGNRCSIVPE